MSVKILNAGDKVYCTKDVYRKSDEKLIFKENNIYTVNHTKSATKTMYNDSKSDEVIISINYTDDDKYAFWLETDRKNNLFSEYFSDHQGYRKRKLEKLNNGRID